MKVEDLKRVLDIIGIPKRYYSINDDLNCDIHVLRKVSDFWEYFYIDERGGQNNGYKRINTEDEACKYFLKIMVEEL